MSRQAKWCAAGLFVGLILGARLGMSGHLSPPPVRVPEPYLAPQLPGGTALRMAMIGDVLHQRFNRHGSAWFEERNRQARKDLHEIEQSGEVGSLEHLNRLDDLAVGLERLGESAAAVDLMREKLQLQREIDEAWWQRHDSGHEPSEYRPLSEANLALYRTYANLGTFLIHGALPKVLAGDDSARADLREGLEALRKAVAINPRAHFGREKWQIVTAELLLAAFDRPEILLQYDLVGHRLKAPLPLLTAKHRPGWVDFWNSLPSGDRSMQKIAQSEPNFQRDKLRRHIRTEWITHTGAESGWTKAVESTHRIPVPFDEPVLGILGMWTLGGGANPHFALALAGAMERIGHWELAWKAYERAVGLSDRFWPRDDIHDMFVAHCRRRQLQLAQRITQEDNLPQTVPEVINRLREEAKHSLAQGQAFQKALAEFEAERIREGYSLDSPTFYRPFLESYGPVTSRVGDEDIVPTDEKTPLRDAFPAAIFYAGLGCVLGLLLARKSPPRDVTLSE